MNGKVHVLCNAFRLTQCPVNFSTVDGHGAQGQQSIHSRYYVDDILVFSQTWDEHLIHITDALQKLETASLILQLLKCKLGAKSCDYLGHQVGQGAISLHMVKVEAVANFKRPVQKKRCKKFSWISQIL